MTNLTLTIKQKMSGIGNECINWCREAQIIQQNNLVVHELYILALALASLALHHFIYNYFDWLSKELKIDENNLQKIYKGCSYFAFFLILIFMIYILYFK